MIVAVSTQNLNDILPIGSGACSKMADVLFIIDKESNLDYTDYVTYVVGLVNSIVPFLLVDSGWSQVAVITYSDTAMVEFYLNNYTRGADVSPSRMFHFTHES